MTGRWAGPRSQPGSAAAGEQCAAPSTLLALRVGMALGGVIVISAGASLVGFLVS
ncbi:hypothetical protein [Actinomyces wuliandei]|uniref:hypothetical protein n=1 Tax=Actinomyces wuliandei TaxID=2057743 RepID=UPI0013E3947E|nr:hypothetical protein [Actinomyces wuliandei]